MVFGLPFAYNVELPFHNFSPKNRNYDRRREQYNTTKNTLA